MMHRGRSMKEGRRAAHTPWTEGSEPEPRSLRTRGPLAAPLCCSSSASREMGESDSLRDLSVPSGESFPGGRLYTFKRGLGMTVPWLEKAAQRGGAGARLADAAGSLCRGVGGGPQSRVVSRWPIADVSAGRERLAGNWPKSTIANTTAAWRKRSSLRIRMTPMARGSMICVSVSVRPSNSMICDTTPANSVTWRRIRSTRRSSRNWPRVWKPNCGPYDPSWESLILSDFIGDR